MLLLLVCSFFVIEWQSSTLTESSYNIHPSIQISPPSASPTSEYEIVDASPNTISDVHEDIRIDMIKSTLQHNLQQTQKHI